VSVTLVLLEIPNDPDSDPPEQWLMRLPEMEGASIIWSRNEEKTDSKHDVQDAKVQGDIRYGFRCGACDEPVVGTNIGWMHKAEWQRRMR